MRCVGADNDIMMLAACLTVIISDRAFFITGFVAVGFFITGLVAIGLEERVEDRVCIVRVLVGCCLSYHPALETLFNFHDQPLLK
jgi:hypothetical protein